MGVICNYAAKFQSDTSYSFFVIAAEKNKNNGQKSLKIKIIIKRNTVRSFPSERGKTLIIIIKLQSFKNRMRRSVARDKKVHK